MGAQRKETMACRNVITILVIFVILLVPPHSLEMLSAEVFPMPMASEISAVPQAKTGTTTTIIERVPVGLKMANPQHPRPKVIMQEPARNLNIEEEDLLQVLDGKVDAAQMMKEKQHEEAVFFGDADDCNKNEGSNDEAGLSQEERYMEGVTKNEDHVSQIDDHDAFMVSFIDPEDKSAAHV